MRETGAICPIVVFTRKRCILGGGGGEKGHLQAFGSMKIVNVLFDFWAFGEKQFFKRHRAKYVLMLCFVVFGHQNRST